MWIEKLGSYFVDVSKYILTGVVISSLFKDFEDKVLIYIVGIALGLLLFFVFIKKKAWNEFWERNINHLND